MRYYTEKPEICSKMYQSVYICDHPVYSKCTLFKIGDKGLAVIQQKYNETSKRTWWGQVDDWLVDLLYLNTRFYNYFKERSGIIDGNGLYPTVTVRQMMWALKMKPLKKERWETCFDRKDI